LVQGQVDFELDEELDIEFRAVGNGAVTNEITVDEDDYSIELQPGKYEIVSDHLVMDGEAKYEISDSLNIEPGDEEIEKDLEAIYKVRLSGEISTIEDDSATIEIDFQGPEDKTIFANESYLVYLEPGNYSIRAVHLNERQTTQIRVDLSEPETRDISLEEAYEMNPEVEGPIGHEIPMSLRNKETGYVIRTTTDMEGNLNLNITSGEYDITVDYVVQEEIQGEMRDVRYHIDQQYSIPPTPGVITLDREILNSTLTGRVTLNGEPLSNIEVGISGVDEEIQTDEAGEYEVEELVHGQYTIYISYSTGGRVYSHFESFEMPAGDKRMDISLEEGVTFSGQVKLEGTGVETEISIRKEEASWDFDTEEDGSFEIILPKGVYHIESETIEERDYGLTTFRFVREIEIFNSISRDIELTKVDEYDMDVIELRSQTAQQGDVIEYTAQVKNTGNTPDEYELSFAETDWDVSVNPERTGVIAPGKTETIRIEITVPEDANVGETVTLVVDSVNSEESLERDIPLEIEQIYGVEIGEETREGRYRPGQLTYSVEVENLGNGPDTFRMEILNREQLRDYGWEVNITEKTEEIDAQDSGTIEIRLNAISANPRRDVELELRATSEGDPSESDRKTISASVPELVAYEDTIEFEGEEFVLEDEPFELSTAQWTGIVILVAIAALFILRKKRWI